MKSLLPAVAIGLLLAALSPHLFANSEATIQINAAAGTPVSPTLYGIFFEEINRAGDGGLYAEMIQNRSFEDESIVDWKMVGSGNGAISASCALDRAKPLNPQNPTSYRLDIKALPAGGRFGIANHGFKLPNRDDDHQNGIAIVQGDEYQLSFHARVSESFAGTITASLEKPDGTVLASARVDRQSGLAGDWKRFEIPFLPSQSEREAVLVLSADQPGTLWLDMVTLFPKKTFKGHGMRIDIAEKIQAMHPAFVRFPGGCFVEGRTMEEAVHWKKTIGDVASRPGHSNLWGYRSTDGLGYHEYLQFCEDIGAEPLFVINVGMAHKDQVPMGQMQEMVQDALDAIEYANGPADSSWGSLRAKAGHPEPFHLKMMEIGNENGGPLYEERYALFHDAIKARYPDILLVANQWRGIPKSRPLDVVDEHYYDTPGFFMSKATLYDTYGRKGAKIYVGEYAVTHKPSAGKLIAALGEAAYMTGMERNGDHVIMASYAPLLERAGWQRWYPNAIVYDSSRIFGTPSYYVQSMFAANRADFSIPTRVLGPQAEVLVKQRKDETRKETLPTLYAVAGRKTTGELILKLVNTAPESQSCAVTVNGIAAIEPRAEATVLTSASPEDANSFDAPNKVAPRTETVEVAAPSFHHTLPANSVTILRLKIHPAP